MKASDVMVSKVITVGPDACVQDVADLLLKNRISAMPVVDASGKILGIVSEGDLIRRVETGTERHRSWWLEILTSNEERATDFVRSHAQKVEDVMTRHVITAEPDTSLGDIAALLEKNGIKRVPIVANGQLVGIVSRANLLQGLAALRKSIATEAPIDDGKLREKVIAQLQSEPWSKPGLINVIVHDGNVELWGIVDSQAEKRAVRVAAEVTPGVRAVNDNLIIRPAYTGT